jgi:hypothetical protein
MPVRWAELLRDARHHLVGALTRGLVVHLLGEVVDIEACKPRKHLARMTLTLPAMTPEAGSTGSAWPTTERDQVPSWNRTCLHGA